MKKLVLMAVAASLLSVGGSHVTNADVASLRGEHPIDALAKHFDRRKQTTKDGGIEKSWKQQPPAIPHKIDKDQITLQVNTCLKCHSTATHEKENAPNAAESHYISADGTKLDKIDGRRHFCTQCHTPLQNVKPLIDNTFETVKQ